MKTTALELSRFAQMVDILDSVAQRRRTQGARSEALYYELLARYYSRALHAREQGQVLVAHSIMFPVDLFYALSAVPFCLEVGISTFMVLLKEYEGLLDASKAFGLNPFLCSVHRSIIGAYERGWAPLPDVVVWSKQACENTAMVGGGVVELCRCPSFYVDRPYRQTLRELHYYAQELWEMVRFLERLTGRRMDLERLRQALLLSGEQIALQREIYKLRQAVPSPAANRRSAQLQAINWLYMGTAEGVEFCRTVLEEMKALAAQGQGAVPRENYRLLSLFPAPIHGWKVLDWMQQEHGANIVADPFLSHWGEWEPDPSHPYESVAQRGFAVPSCRAMHGPMAEAVVQDALEDAQAFQAQGVIYWANIGCSHGCAMIRRLKDAITQELGLPFLVVDMEYADPSIVPHQEIKERLEGFFEVLGERGGGG